MTVIAIGCLLASAAPVEAASYTWTNGIVGQLSGFWTNNNGWKPAPGQPGTAAGDNAYLTNQVGIAYTNILNVGLANSLGTIAISNAPGQAWLTITNSTANPGIIITNGTFVLGSGGRLQLDSGATLSNNALTWVGTNGQVILNNGSQLYTATGVTIGNSISSSTGQVTSISGAGFGGQWNLLGQNLTVGSSGSRNALMISAGAVLTNGGAVTLGNGSGASFNSLAISNGAQLFSAGNSFIGNGAGANSNLVTLGNNGATWNLGNGVLTIGTGGATGNVLVVNSGGSVVAAGVTVSATAADASNNVVVNGGTLMVTNAAYERQPDHRQFWHWPDDGD